MPGKHQIDITVCGQLIKLLPYLDHITVIVMRPFRIRRLVSQKNLPCCLRVLRHRPCPGHLSLGNLIRAVDVIGIQYNEGSVFICKGIVNSLACVLFWNIYVVMRCNGI